MNSLTIHILHDLPEAEGDIAHLRGLKEEGELSHCMRLILPWRFFMQKLYLPEARPFGDLWTPLFPGSA
jgi:hypothetical protein